MVNRTERLRRNPCFKAWDFSSKRSLLDSETDGNPHNRTSETISRFRDRVLIKIALGVSAFSCARPAADLEASPLHARKNWPMVPRVGLKFSETMISVLGNIRRSSKTFIWSPYWDRSRRCAFKMSKDDGLHRFFRWLWKLLENFQLVLRDSQTECEMTVKLLPMKTA